MEKKLAALLRKHNPYATKEWIEEEVRKRLPSEPVEEAFDSDEEPVVAVPEAALVVPATFEEADLTQITGIGEKIQEMLREHGVMTIQDIAALTSVEIQAFDEKLSFHGRIEREQWVEQARALLYPKS